jgi:hypothetical protein
METSKQRFFIYDRREMVVLILLGLLIAAFAFTLGVHLGKRVSHQAAHEAVKEPTPVATSPDLVPNRQELNEQAKGVEQAVEEVLDQSLHDEVARTGVKLETPVPVELPEKTKSANGGATSPQTEAVQGLKVSKPAGVGTKPAAQAPAVAAPAKASVQAPAEVSGHTAGETPHTGSKINTPKENSKESPAHAPNPTGADQEEADSEPAA